LSASGTAVAQDAIRVGVLTIRSGPAKPIGDDILAGIESATKMYGPVLNRPVELVVEESLFTAQGAVTKATKLVQQNKVAGILGTSTIETLALLSVADRLGVPIITSNSGSAAITRDRCNRWVFRTNAEDLMSVESLQELVKETPRLQQANGSRSPRLPVEPAGCRPVKGVKDRNMWRLSRRRHDRRAPFVASARPPVTMPVTWGPAPAPSSRRTSLGRPTAVLVSPIGFLIGRSRSWEHIDERQIRGLLGGLAMRKPGPPPRSSTRCPTRRTAGWRNAIAAVRQRSADVLQRHERKQALTDPRPLSGR
jgi:hypothetical protein